MYRFFLREVNEMKTWQDIGFEIEITGDGSPSLRLLTSVDPTKDKGESMHHSGGASSETDLIYGAPIRETFQKITKPHFLIVGLGLGYIELVIAREALLANLGDSSIGKITSYESVPELREYFFKWLHNDTDLHVDVQKTYDLVLEHVLKSTNLGTHAVKSVLKKHFVIQNDIRGSLASDVTMESRYHCILYDAFSSKTSPFLWEEEFLNHLLATGSAEESVLSTYACKGTLKRALKNQGFEVIVREGFQGKRNSTMGKKNFAKM